MCAEPSDHTTSCAIQYTTLLHQYNTLGFTNAARLVKPLVCGFTHCLHQRLLISDHQYNTLLCACSVNCSNVQSSVRRCRKGPHRMHAVCFRCATVFEHLSTSSIQPRQRRMARLPFVVATERENSLLPRHSERDVDDAVGSCGGKRMRTLVRMCAFERGSGSDQVLAICSALLLTPPDDDDV